MKTYYVEKANCWVVEGFLSKAAREIISDQFSYLGLEVLFCDEFFTVKEERVLPVTGEAGRKSFELLTKQIDKLSNVSNTHLLEIKLKDTNSVPEVYYKGEKIEGLFDVAYHYRTTTDRVDGSANDINIEYFDKVDKFPDKKIIGHKREV